MSGSFKQKTNKQKAQKPRLCPRASIIHVLHYMNSTFNIKYTLVFQDCMAAVNLRKSSADYSVETTALFS